ncbi:phasin family protein [Limnohabitans sp. DCL3]|uniref:phasin family protein n=1 Tax=Limnohabitans sp. DCL3 TaxID=3374103 RepID=UPI003A857A06
MAKSNNTPRNPSSASATPDNSTPPAQHVWLAGLGAMAKAQEQGSKAIEALLSDGLAFQRKSQAEAQQRLHEATERLSHLASDFGQQATGRVDKLEHLFEDRVAKALHRLGMPSLLDIQMLSDRVAQLESQLAALKTPPAPAKKTPAKAAAHTTAKTAAQTAAPSAAKTPVKNTRSKSA